MVPQSRRIRETHEISFPRLRRVLEVGLTKKSSSKGEKRVRDWRGTNVPKSFYLSPTVIRLLETWFTKGTEGRGFKILLMKKISFSPSTVMYVKPSSFWQEGEAPCPHLGYRLSTSHRLWNGTPYNWWPETPEGFSLSRSSFAPPIKGSVSGPSTQWSGSNKGGA